MKPSKKDCIWKHKLRLMIWKCTEWWFKDIVNYRTTCLFFTFWVKVYSFTSSSVRWNFSLKLNGWAEPATTLAIISRPLTIILSEESKHRIRKNISKLPRYLNTSCSQSLTCRRHSASSHGQWCLFHLRSAKQTWGRSSNGQISSLWWWRSYSRRWDLQGLLHSGV